MHLIHYILQQMFGFPSFSRNGLHSKCQLYIFSLFTTNSSTLKFPSWYFTDADYFFCTYIRIYCIVFFFLKVMIFCIIANDVTEL